MEAIIVEVTADKSADLGVNWVIVDHDANGDQLPVGGFIAPVGGTSNRRDPAGRAARPEHARHAVPRGATSAIGRLVDQRHQLRGGDPGPARRLGNTNIIATPSP